nr:retrovirus-related Pol polyprotein from transposon TNT 1-94 [Tanacetum cinerariifolium]
MQTQTSNTLHNAIMKASGKDRSPMLAPGNYVQWKSRIKRYIDTKPNHELIHYCLKNPPYKFTWANKEVPISEGSSVTTIGTYMENYKNVSQDIRDQLNAEAEAVQIILTGIDNNIYSTVDACPNACEMRKVNERSQQAATRNKGKAIVNSPQPIYDQEPSMVAEDDEMSKDKEIDKLMALISLSGTGYESQRIGHVARTRETVGITLVQKSRSRCYNCKEFGHVVRECQKPKRVKDAAYHREKMILCKQEEAGIHLNAEQADWRDDTDVESEDQELEAHYMYMAQIQEVSPDAADFGPIFDSEPLQKVSNDDHYNVFAIESEHPEQSKSVHNTYPIEQDEHNMIIDSFDMSYDREQIDHNDDDDDLANERELFASLIEKLKCKINDIKNRNKFLETSNKVLVEKLKGKIEDFKNKNKSLESSNNRFKEANNKLSETNALMYKDLKKFQAELERRNDVEYASKKLSAHQETISIPSQAKEAHIKLYKTREDKELDKVIALENKVKKAQRANPGLYDIGCYNDNLALMLAPEFDEVIRLKRESRSKLSDLIRPFDYDKLNNLYDLFVLQREKSSEQRYFSKRSRMSHTPVNNGNSKEYFNKQTTLLEKLMDESIPWDQKCKSSKELFKIKRSVGTIFDGVECCKETIAKRTYFEEMVADLKYFNSLELEVDSLRSQLESQKTQFLNEIDRLSRKYYNADHMNEILGVYTELDEVTNLQCDYMEMLEKCECLKKELSKCKMMSRSFEALHKHAINLEIDLQQCQEKIKNEKSFKKKQSKEFRKERKQYFEIQDSKAQLQDKGIAISELKKLIEKLKGKSVDTKFEKSSVIRQPNAFKSKRPSILGKPTIFSDSLERKDFSKSKSVTKNNVSNDFSKLVNAQILPPNKKSILKNTNMLAPGMYKLHTKPTQTRTTQLPNDSRKTNKRVSFSTGVIPTTSVSIPQLKSNPMKDRVMLHNSQGKKQEVEDQCRNVKVSKNKTSVTACNDSLNAKTSNVKFVCATCGKCVLNDKHDMCVFTSLDGVNSRTKMPIAVPVSTREPKRTVNQSVAKPLRKIVASESNQKPRNTIRKVYERISKACSWWYPKFTPSRYNWKPKSKIGNVKPNVSMPLGNASRTANVLDPMTSRHSTVSNTPLSSNSFAARRDYPIHPRLWRLLSATITLSNKAEDPYLSFHKWYQSLVRSFNQQKNNIQAHQKKKMVKSSSSLENKPCCYKSCKKNTDSLNSKITQLTDKLSDMENMLYHYKLGLSQVEGRLVEHKDQEIKYCKKIRGLELEVEFKTNSLECLTKELETLKKEKEGLNGKLAGFQTASKDLDSLLENDTITDYSRPSPTIESNTNDTNINSFVSETRESPSIIISKHAIKFVKAAKRPTTDKVETTKKPAVKYAELYRKTTKRSTVRGNQRNWNNLKSQQLGENFVMKNKACFNCGHFDHLSYNCGFGEKIGRSSPKNNYTHMSLPLRPVIHRPYRPPMRPVKPNMNDRVALAEEFALLVKIMIIPSQRDLQRLNSVESLLLHKVSHIAAFRDYSSFFCKHTVPLFLTYSSKDLQRLNSTESLLLHKVSYIVAFRDYSVQQSSCLTRQKILISVSIDLEVAFRKSTCYIRDLKGNDLLTGSRGTDSYSITLHDTTSPNLIFLMAKVTSSQAWLWHRRLSHLNFDTINLLSKNDIMVGLLMLKFFKDHLCSSCELGKAKRKSFQTKTTPSSKRLLQLLHMDLCGPMRVASINGKKYVLVIVDDYSRYTWTHFLRSKDETPEVLIDFLRLVQRGLHAQ